MHPIHKNSAMVETHSSASAWPGQIALLDLLRKDEKLIFLYPNQSL